LIPIITSATEQYLPGVIALHNSYLKNSREGFSFHVLSYGDESLKKELQDRGMNVLHNVFMNCLLPKSQKYSWYRQELESHAMYSRLLIPELFRTRYSIYVDADAIILKSLKDLFIDLQDFPCGGTESWSPMKADVPDVKEVENFKGIMTSFLVFNHEVWERKEIYNKCIHLMKTSSFHFKTVVQGVLQYILRSDYYKYPSVTQAQASHKDRDLKKAHFLHFVGVNPWEEMPNEPHRMQALNIWKEYA